MLLLAWTVPDFQEALGASGGNLLTGALLRGRTREGCQTIRRLREVWRRGVGTSLLTPSQEVHPVHPLQPRAQVHGGGAQVFKVAGLERPPADVIERHAAEHGRRGEAGLARQEKEAQGQATNSTTTTERSENFIQSEI